MENDISNSPARSLQTRSASVRSASSESSTQTPTRKIAKAKRRSIAIRNQQTNRASNDKIDSDDEDESGKHLFHICR